MSKLSEKKKLELIREFIFTDEQQLWIYEDVHHGIPKESIKDAARFEIIDIEQNMHLIEKISTKEFMDDFEFESISDVVKQIKKAQDHINDWFWSQKK